MARGALVVLGGSGLVGARASELWSRSTEVIAPRHSQLDVLDSAALEAFLAGSHAMSVMNFVAWADVDGAESERGRTDGLVYRLNVEFPARLAELCHRLGKHLVHVSTDYVFDGTSSARPYREEDAPNPLCWYAETKRAGEMAVLGAHSGACVARIEMPFTGARHAKRDLARLVASRLEHGQTVQGVTDQRITPVFLDDAAAALHRLAEARHSDIVHLASADWTTPYDLARGIAQGLGLDTELVQPVSFAEFAPTRPARRPQHSWLDTSRFTHTFGPGILRSVQEQLASWTAQWQSK